MSRKSLFPPVSIDEALVIAQAVWEHNAGNPMRRITIFDILGKQPESSASRSLITASGGYGLTEGNYRSELIHLTELGRSVVAENDTSAKLSAVLDVEVFRSFFERYKEATIPSQAAALDFLKAHGLPETGAANCLEVILENARQVGLVREISGKERIVTPEHALEEASKHKKAKTTSRETLDDKGSPQVGSIQPVSRPSLESPQLNQVPTLHIDVQIHISADAKPEQIDQIFASMAKHLFRKGE